MRAPGKENVEGQSDVRDNEIILREMERGAREGRPVVSAVTPLALFIASLLGLRDAPSCNWSAYRVV